MKTDQDSVSETDRVLLSAKGAILLGSGTLLVLAALLLANGPLLAMGIGLCGPVLLVRFRRADVSVERRLMTSQLLEGESTEVELHACNRGSRAISLTIHDHVSGVLLPEGDSAGLWTVLAPGETEVLRYRVKAPLRGLHLIGPARLRIHDVHHLRTIERTISGASTLTVGIAPQAIGPSLTVALQSPQPLLPRPRPGGGGDFHIIRDYTSGDPLRRINWKASARRRRLLVNELDHEDRPPLLVLVDARGPTAAGSPRCNFLEIALKDALAQVHRAVVVGRPVALEFLQPDSMPLGSVAGIGGFERLCSVVASVKASGEGPLAPLVLAALDRFPADTEVHLLTPLWNPTDPEGLAALPRPIAIRTAPLVLFEAAATPIDHARAALARWSHQRRIDALSRHGHAVTVWGRDDVQRVYPVFWPTDIGPLDGTRTPPVEGVSS